MKQGEEKYENLKKYTRVSLRFDLRNDLQFGPGVTKQLFNSKELSKVSSGLTHSFSLFRDNNTINSNQNKN